MAAGIASRDILARRLTVLARQFGWYQSLPQKVRRRTCLELLFPIRIQDCWSQFNRDVILNWAVEDGTHPTYVDALIASRVKRDGRIGSEPKWYNAAEAAGVAKRMNVRNYSDFAAAIGDLSSPAEDIRRIRNYCAHQSSDDCVRKASDVVGGANLTANTLEDYLGEYVEGGAQRFQNWVERLVVIADVAMAER